jgi:hypothetical protein
VYAHQRKANAAESGRGNLPGLGRHRDNVGAHESTLLPKYQAMLTLQRQAGNRAVIDLLGPVQRSNGEERGSGEKTRQSKPRDAPRGTKPIDQSGLDREDVHKIKDGIGAGPRDWVGITPEGHVITSDEDGNAEDHGPFESYLPRVSESATARRLGAAGAGGLIGAGAGAVLGGALGAIIGGTGGTLVAPGVGTVGGGAAGAVAGAEAGAWVGAAAGTAIGAVVGWLAGG